MAPGGRGQLVHNVCVLYTLKTFKYKYTNTIRKAELHKYEDSTIHFEFLYCVYCGPGGRQRSIGVRCV